MKKTAVVLSCFAMVLLLAACGANAEEGSAAELGGLNENHADALPVSTQLALGSLQLEDTDLVIEETQAADLVPLWQAFQTLSESDKTADAEVAAVLAQIQETMTAEQIEAIATMALTAEDATAWMQEAGGGFGRGAMMGDYAADGSGSGGAAAGGGRPAGGGFREFGGGGLPGSGMPGMGGGFGEMDTDARATRIAGMGGEVEDMMAAFANRALTNALIRSLQVKTGELDAAEVEARWSNQTLWNTVSESTGIRLETLQEGTANGATLAEVIRANEGDLEAVKAALAEAFRDMPAMEGLDVEQRISDLLNSSLRSGRPSE